MPESSEVRTWLYEPVIVKLFDDKIKWAVRIVRNGDRYGLRNCITHDEDEPLVEFYDTRQNFGPLGQFVSRYNLSTLFSSRSYMLSKAVLLQMFGSDNAMGARYDVAANGGNGGSVFPDGSSAVHCFAYAQRVKQMLPDHDVQVVGFYTDDNPDCDMAKECLVSGHDFAIVDHRWLVDSWFQLVESDKSKPMVYDLFAPEDSALATRIYGTPSHWEAWKDDNKRHSDGLLLDTGSPDWTISGPTMADIKAWVSGFLGF